MLKSILKHCCAYRTGLTPFYCTNARTVDLKDGEFILFTWFDYFRAIPLFIDVARRAGKVVINLHFIVTARMEF